MSKKKSKKSKNYIYNYIYKIGKLFFCVKKFILENIDITSYEKKSDKTMYINIYLLFIQKILYNNEFIEKKNT